MASPPKPEVNAPAAAMPVQTGYSLTPDITRTTSSTNNIQSQLLRLLLSTAGVRVPAAVDHTVEALRIAPVALGGGLGRLGMNSMANSLLQGPERLQLPITDRELHWPEFAVWIAMFLQDIKNITGTALSDAVRLQYLERLLDPTNHARICDKRERGIEVSVNEEWLRLDGSMGIARLQALSRAWNLLTCSGSNDLTHDKFDAFEVYLRRLESNLHTVTEDQAYERLMAILPDRNVTALHRKEAKISSDKTTFGMSAVNQEVTSGSLVAMITNAGLPASRSLVKERATTVLRVDRDKSNKYMKTLYVAVMTTPQGTQLR